MQLLFTEKGRMVEKSNQVKAGSLLLEKKKTYLILKVITQKTKKISKEFLSQKLKENCFQYEGAALGGFLKRGSKGVNKRSN